MPYILLGIWFPDDRSSLHIFIIKARTKSCRKIEGNIMLSQHTSDRKRQFAVQIHVQESNGESSIFRDFQGAGQIEGKLQIFISQLLQDIFHREGKHGVIFDDQDGKFRHGTTFAACFIGQGKSM